MKKHTCGRQLKRKNLLWSKFFKIFFGATLIGSVLSLQATPLSPGSGTVSVPGETDPVGGTVLFQTNVDFLSGSFSGILTSTVLSGDTSNPFSGLTFTYEFNINPAGPDPASGITIGSFSNLFVDVSYQTPAAGVIPATMSRTPGIGKNINFSFIDSGYVNPGENSALLVIQTDAPGWTLGSATISDDVGTVVSALVPVPEPASVALMTMGALSVVCFGRKKIFKK